ncbi:MAG: sigma-70 family RNA polymerase sigma factor [Phycisphaeraceae bacterium]|nr:sigma-70 family RNA polymerase sigma factor [Phycisphaeraceae bacterium]
MKRHDDHGQADDAKVAQWLSLAASGDQQAWRGLVDQYARRIFAMAWSRLRSAESAEEITQSVFATVAVKLCNGAYTEQGRFESWLFRVAMNRVRDEVRRSSRQAAPAGPELFERMEGRARENESGAGSTGTAELRRAIARLGDSEQEMIHLRHHAGLSFKQIADLLEEPLGTVLARHHRTLRKLKGMLEGTEESAETDASDEGRYA